MPSLAEQKPLLVPHKNGFLHSDMLVVFLLVLVEQRDLRITRVHPGLKGGAGGPCFTLGGHTFGDYGGSSFLIILNRRSVSHGTAK